MRQEINNGDYVRFKKDTPLGWSPNEVYRVVKKSKPCIFSPYYYCDIENDSRVIVDVCIEDLVKTIINK